MAKRKKIVVDNPETEINEAELEVIEDVEGTEEESSESEIPAEFAGLAASATENGYNRAGSGDYDFSDTPTLGDTNTQPEVVRPRTETLTPEPDSETGSTDLTSEEKAIVGIADTKMGGGKKDTTQNSDDPVIIPAVEKDKGPTVISEPTATATTTNENTNSDTENMSTQNKLKELHQYHKNNVSATAYCIGVPDELIVKGVEDLSQYEQSKYEGFYNSIEYWYDKLIKSNSWNVELR